MKNLINREFNHVKRIFEDIKNYKTLEEKLSFIEVSIRCGTTLRGQNELKLLWYLMYFEKKKGL